MAAGAGHEDKRVWVMERRGSQQVAHILTREKVAEDALHLEARMMKLEKWREESVYEHIPQARCT